MASSSPQFTEVRQILRDSETGQEVWQMTSGEGENVAPYMYCQAMSPDERYLCFESKRTGAWLPYRLEVATGRVCPLAQCDDYGVFSLNMRPGRGELMFRSGLRIWAVDVETCERRVLVDGERLKDAAELGGICQADASGERLAVHYVDRDRRHGIAMALADGMTVESVFRRDEGIQHVSINPTRPDLVSFAVSPDRQDNPKETRERRARAWLLDSRTGHAEPYLVMPPGFRATHEYWAPSGERLYFHKKSVPGWIPTWVNSIGLDGTGEQEHFRSDTLYLGHSCVNRAGTRIISDEQRQGGRNVLMDIDTRARTGRVLCWPNLMLRPGSHCHVHPSLSPSEKFVVYTSNVTGSAQVYLLPLPDQPDAG